MRKSRRQKLTAGEWDTVSRGARAILIYLARSGVKKWFKKQMSRRWRREGKKEARDGKDMEE